MKEKLRLLFEKVKLLFKKVVGFLGKVWLFLKKWGLHLINLFVIILAYDFVSDSLLIGLWLFFLLAYYIFWELLGAKTLRKKDKEDET
jgi:hypothetical protein